MDGEGAVVGEHLLLDESVAQHRRIISASKQRDIVSDGVVYLSGMRMALRVI